VSLISLLERILRLRANPRLVAITRIMIGIAAALAAFEACRLLTRLLEASVIKLPYFELIPMLSPRILPIFIGLWLLAAVAFVVGWKTRIAGGALAIVIGYTLLLDQQAYSNHLYLLFLMVLLLTLADSGAALSLDAARLGTRTTIAGWPVLLLKIQVSTVYIFSAIAKVTPEYLSGEVLTQSLKQYGYFAVPLSWRVPNAMRVLAVTAIALELFIGLALWSKRLRLGALVAGVAFHALIIAAIDSSRLSLGVFALEMFAVYLLFFDAPYGETPTLREDHK
jgi:Vitamin K-dependent gamma-carboxylase